MPETRKQQRVSAWNGGSHYVGECVYFSPELNPNSLENTVIPQGALMNYGDCAFSPVMLNTRHYKQILQFDKEKGKLRCQSGISIGELLNEICPNGWMLPVCPGTQHVTVGGAIASDVHGKNHIAEGCFSEHIEALSLLTHPHGSAINCSRQENSDLFHATCGGMGLTGLIYEVSIQLKPIRSTLIKQQEIITRSLRETLNVFEQNKQHEFIVAWIDNSAPENQLGRGSVAVADYLDIAQEKKTAVSKPVLSNRKRLSVPFYFPASILHPSLTRVGNQCLYRKKLVKQKLASEKDKILALDKFLFPLDAIGNWYRIYGKAGFTQYQCVFPKDNSEQALTEILEICHKHKEVPVLSVLKQFRAANQNLLSFPMKGFSIAMDFRNSTSLKDTLASLDEIVHKHHGRIYLAKDNRLNALQVRQQYPNLETFKSLRKHYEMDKHFSSLLSKRLAL